MAEVQGAALRPIGDFLLGPVMDLEMAKTRLAQFQDFVKSYLVEDEDFGKIPGTPKPTLLKPGADKLCELYGLADDYEVVEKVESYETGLFDYTIKCIITSRRDGRLVATGLGSCNSYEKKYRWRKAERECPNCGQPTIIKGREEYGGGWVCYAKKGGCGAKFHDKDEAITGQNQGRVQNEDIADTKNTILKMAKKRAKIDATLSATRSSGVFTQDLEDMARSEERDEPPQQNGHSERMEEQANKKDKEQRQQQAANGGGKKEEQAPPSTVSAARSKFFGIAKEAGWSMPAVKHLLTAMFKDFNTSKMSPEQLGKAVKIMKSGDPDEVLANLDQYNF